MNRSRIVKFCVIIILFVLFTETAQAWAWSNWFGLADISASQKLHEIELKKELLTENMHTMKFINSNMFDEGVDTVEISIKNKGQILKTYYILRAEDQSGTPSIVESIPDQLGVLWKFKPTLDQASNGLDHASTGLLILEQTNKSKIEVILFVLNGLSLYYGVESENVPSLSELIQKSSCRKCKTALSWAGISS